METKRKICGRNNRRRQMVDAAVNDAQAETLAVEDASNEFSEYTALAVEDGSKEVSEDATVDVPQPGALAIEDGSNEISEDATVDDAQPDTLVVEDGSNKVADYALGRDSVMCDKTSLNSLAEPCYSLSSCEVASYSSQFCGSREEMESSFNMERGNHDPREHFVTRRHQRDFCTDKKACLSLIASSYLNDRSDLCLELYHGFADKNIRPDTNEGMGIFLECLTRSNLIGSSDFVCRSGLLTNICTTPFIGGEFDNGMIVSIQRIGGTFYMQQFETDEHKHDEKKMTTKQKNMEYGGRRFEILVAENAKSNTTPNLHEEYISVRKIQFGGHSLLIRGQIDGIRSDDESYVELKTTTDVFDYIHPVKAVKWWFQCTFAGATNILCGFRNDESGIVKRIKWYKVKDFIESEDAKSFSQVGKKSLQGVLDFVKQRVTKEYQPYCLKRKKGSKTFQLSQDNKHKFLPLWLFNYTQP